MSISLSTGAYSVYLRCRPEFNSLIFVFMDRPVSKACTNCRNAKLKCDTNRPCLRCIQAGKQDECIDYNPRPRGRKRGPASEARHQALLQQKALEAEGGAHGALPQLSYTGQAYAYDASSPNSNGLAAGSYTHRLAATSVPSVVLVLYFSVLFLCFLARLEPT